MTSPEAARFAKRPRIPRNLWAVSVTSFLTDISSEMVQNLLPLFLANVLGVRTVTIGLIEGVAESTSSLLKVFSGALADRLGVRKSLAVAGYALSAIAKPGFYFATSWGLVAGVRWAERAGKGVRTAPRDALVADSVDAPRRGLAFGFHRAADTGGAVVGLLIAIAAVQLTQRGAVELGRSTFQVLVLLSLVPAFLAVLTLALGATEVAVAPSAARPRIGLRGLGRGFAVFLGISILFDLGNSSDAFLVLRAQERGLGVTDLLWMLLAFNLVYALISAPAGSFSDRFGRKRVIVAGWALYAAVYLGFALADDGRQVVALYLCYGAYYGLVTGTARALVADLVPPRLRGTAYGTYHAALGLIDLPASLIAGLLWQGVGAWEGFGPSAPFFFGGATALAAAVLLALFVREPAD
jgi:MFS family permease